jgi:hypothetical protein
MRASLRWLLQSENIMAKVFAPVVAQSFIHMMDCICTNHRSSGVGVVFLQHDCCSGTSFRHSWGVQHIKLPLISISQESGMMAMCAPSPVWEAKACRSLESTNLRSLWATQWDSTSKEKRQFERSNTHYKYTTQVLIIFSLHFQQKNESFLIPLFCDLSFLLYNVNFMRIVTLKNSWNHLAHVIMEFILYIQPTYSFQRYQHQ